MSQTGVLAGLDLLLVGQTGKEAACWGHQLPAQQGFLAGVTPTGCYGNVAVGRQHPGTDRTECLQALPHSRPPAAS